jgi:hypothetical protein
MAPNVNVSPGSFEDAVAAYGTAARTSLRGPGDPEAQLTGPVTEFVTNCGVLARLAITTHAEVREQEGAVRPDLGVLVPERSGLPRHARVPEA